MFETICTLIPRDPHYPARARTLDILKRVLDGKLYDVLPYQFHEERGAGGERSVVLSVEKMGTTWPSVEDEGDGRQSGIPSSRNPLSRI